MIAGLTGNVVWEIAMVQSGEIDFSNWMIHDYVNAEGSAEMSLLQNVPLEDLEKELNRRRSLQVSEIRRKIEAHRAEIRQLEQLIREAEGGAPAAAVAQLRKPRTALPRIPQGERADRILRALDGTDGLAPSDIASRVGFDGIALRATLSELIAERRIVRFGKARGTKYRLS